MYMQLMILMGNAIQHPTDTKMQRRNRQLKLKITQPKSRTLQSFVVPSSCLGKPIIVTNQQFHKNHVLN